MDWKYGCSTVTFDTATDQVNKWNNSDGNLIVEVIPGPDVTESAFFTFGFQKDDVAHLRGTPTSVTIWAFGEEDWQYGLSTVTFDSTTDRVIEWNNSDGNLKVGDECRLLFRRVRSLGSGFTPVRPAP